MKSHDIHVMAWDRIRFGSQAPVYPARDFGPHVSTHFVKVLPRYWSAWNKGYPSRREPILNEWLLSAGIRRLCAKVKPELIVLTSTHYATGFPSLPADIPVVLDHIDEMPEWVARYYFNAADAVAAVSPALVNNAKIWHESVSLIENGVDLERYSPSKRDEAKRQLALEGKVVVSLIGLTCSSRLYFLEAFEKFSEKVPNAVLLLVGECGFKQKVEACRADIRVLGHVPYDVSAVYFNATDIGLYPGDDTPYYRESHPLKIVEYTAAGCQVVISPVDAFAKGWPNVRTCSPTVEDFAREMFAALKSPNEVADVTSLSWETKAGEFERLLLSTERNKQRET